MEVGVEVDVPVGNADHYFGEDVVGHLAFGLSEAESDFFAGLGVLAEYVEEVLGFSVDSIWSGQGHCCWHHCCGTVSCESLCQS